MRSLKRKRAAIAAYRVKHPLGSVGTEEVKQATEFCKKQYVLGRHACMDSWNRDMAEKYMPFVSRVLTYWDIPHKYTCSNNTLVELG